MTEKKRKKHVWREIADYIGILAGAAISALSFVWFIIPNALAPGGVSGIATILHGLLSVPVGGTIFAINIPLFMISWKEAGWRFGVKSLVGTAALSVLIDLFEAVGIRPLAEEPLLGALFGGMMMGMGLGIVFRSNGSTGGTDIVGKVLVKRFPGHSLASYLLGIDLCIVIAGGIVSRSALVALYSMICVFVSSKTIDILQHGLSAAKVYYIISDRHEEIAQCVNTQLQRGATLLRGEGSYTGAEKRVLLCIVLRSEIASLKRIIHRIDPAAFVFVMEASEVEGLGFSPEERKKLF